MGFWYDEMSDNEKKTSFDIDNDIKRLIINMNRMCSKSLLN